MPVLHVYTTQVLVRLCNRQCSNCRTFSGFFCRHCFTFAINFALYLIHRSIYVALELFAYILCQAFLGFYRRLMFAIDYAFMFTEDHIFISLIYLCLGL